MNIDGIAKSKEGEFHFAVALRAFELIVCKNPVINTFGGSSLIISLSPFAGIAGDRSEQAKIFSKLKVSNLAIFGFIAATIIRAGNDLTGNHRATIFDTVFGSIKPPVKHLMTVRADGDIVNRQLNVLQLGRFITAGIEVNKRLYVPLPKQVICRIVVMSRVGKKAVKE